jgi:glycosyltransferase involved in cell wall biosynthesis
MTAPHFTVLLPVHRPPALLPYAVRSVLAQSCADLELFIVCDGAPDATVEAAEDFAKADPRVRVFAHPKGERHGEAYRHLALQEARGRYVCQIGDDDLWFDNHLVEAERLMGVADFGNLLGMQLLLDGTPRFQFADLANGSTRLTMQQTRYNFFGPTSAAYRLETYRALPVGWSPAPADLWTDLFMWRKFLALPGVRCATWPVATSLGFPATLRTGLSLEERRQEIDRYATRIADAESRDALWRAALLDLANQVIGFRRQAYDEAQKSAAAEGEVAAMAEVLAEIVAADGDADTQSRLARAALEDRSRGGRRPER